MQPPSNLLGKQAAADGRQGVSREGARAGLLAPALVRACGLESLSIPSQVNSDQTPHSPVRIAGGGHDAAPRQSCAGCITPQRHSAAWRCNRTGTADTPVKEKAGKILVKRPMAYSVKTNATSSRGPSCVRGACASPRFMSVGRSLMLKRAQASLAC